MKSGAKSRNRAAYLIAAEARKKNNYKQTARGGRHWSGLDDGDEKIEPITTAKRVPRQNERTREEDGKPESEKEVQRERERESAARAKLYKTKTKQTKKPSQPAK